MLKTSKRNIVTVEKSKNVRWKVNVDLRISYTNVQLQQQVIHEKVYLGTAEGDFKQRYQNHKKSFRNPKYANETSLPKYIWEIKDKQNISPNLMRCIVKSVPGYSNISKRCMLCLLEKYETLNHPHQEELLSKRSELVSNCWHVNKFLLSHYKSNDQCINQLIKYYQRFHIDCKSYFT